MRIKLPRVTQQTESHCGPAVLKMVLQHLGYSFSQDEIVVAAGIQKSIISRGSRPAQLAKAVKKLTPNLKYRFKQHATLQDIEYLVKECQIPVVVNWQGLFYKTLEEETPSNRNDRGHYSVVTDIDLKKETITIADPYPTFAKKDRVFDTSWFVKRWRDRVREKNVKTNQFEVLKTTHFMFMVLPPTFTYPRKLQLLSERKLNILKTTV